MLKASFWAAVGGVVFLAVQALAEEPVFLDKIIVTPYRYEEALSKTASSVSVVNPGDAKHATAQRVVDLLRPVPGITVRDWYGNGNKAEVDIGGFGEQAALNVLVLVDGRRVNDVDLGGVDWSQIPLDQVARVEVIRGGSSGVLYGDNASSGVINIITKKGKGKPKATVHTRYGSYDFNSQKLSVGGGWNNSLSWWLSAGRESTHGYRNNSYDRANDFSAKFEYDITDTLSMNFNTGSRASTYGLPASLFQSHIDQFGRRYAKYGDDHVNNKDTYYMLGWQSKFGEFGNLGIDFIYRRKKTDLYALTSAMPFGASAGIKKNMVKTFGMTPKYMLGSHFFNHENKFVTGVDYYRTDFDSNNYAMLGEGVQSLSGVRKTSYSVYAQNEFTLYKKLVLVGGYRYEAASYAFGYHDETGMNPDIHTKVNPKMKVYNAGLLYTYQGDSNVFFTVGKSFRFPQVDEFTYYDDFFVQRLDTNLRPQSSTNYQVGLRHWFSERTIVNLSLFRMKVKDYLFFNNVNGALGWTGRNENYDRSVHEGMELSFQGRAGKYLDLAGSYTFTKAYFAGGMHDNNDIPLVPRNKAALSAKLLLPSNFSVSLTGNYVGKRYYLNDQANSYSRLNGYLVADMSFSWKYKEAEITLGVNNLFNRLYSEYAGVVLFTGEKFYYPSPERNYCLKVDYAF